MVVATIETTTKTQIRMGTDTMETKLDYIVDLLLMVR